jgi:hypothetical protein
MFHMQQTNILQWSDYSITLDVSDQHLRDDTIDIIGWYDLWDDTITLDVSD